MIDQTTFDTDLAALVGAIGSLVAAVEGRSVSAPDLTNEDLAVHDAAATVAAELAKIAPTASAGNSAGNSSTTTNAPGAVTNEDGTITTVNEDGSTTTTSADGSPLAGS